MRELTDRMRALEHHVHDAIAGRREEFTGGMAYFNDALPAVWDLNFVRLDRPCEAPALECDRLQAGMGHRKLLIDRSTLAARFSRGLHERGFGERRLVALAREPGGSLDPDVRAVACANIADLRRQVTRERLMPHDPEVVEQLVAAGELNERAGGRWLALFEDGRAVAHCIVYSEGGLAQIEDVATLERFRGRGMARRLLEHALEFVAAGHDTVFIQAEADDWTPAFYERLGFTPVEDRYDFLLIVAGS